LPARSLRTRWAPPLTAPLVAALALSTALLGACSSSEGSAPVTTVAVSAEQWASGVCGVLDTWIVAVQSSLTSPDAPGDPSRKLTTRIDGISTATAAAVASLQSIAPPTTTNGAKAKSELEGLGSRLHDSVAVVRTFTTAKVASAADLAANTASLSSAVANSGRDVQDTLDRIEKLDPTGELQRGFAAAATCRTLATDVSRSGTGSADATPSSTAAGR